MSPYVNWHVGMKVVCVDASARGKVGVWWPGEELAEGETYCIAKIFVDYEGTLVVALDGLDRSEASQYYGSEVGYSVTRFRPVQTRNTDISIFTAMLQGTNSKVSA